MFCLGTTMNINSLCWHIKQELKFVLTVCWKQLQKIVIIEFFTYVLKKALGKSPARLLKSALNFVNDLYNFAFLLKYFVCHIFQILYIIFVHASFLFICQKLYPHLFVLRYLRIPHISIFYLSMHFYLWIQWIFMNTLRLYLEDILCVYICKHIVCSHFLF